jgi:hypothetical protein
MTIQANFKCPRRAEGNFGPARENDYDTSDDSCHYCGSLNPDTLMARLEAGDVLLGSTDKNYKVYVRSAPDSPLFKQTFRQCPQDKEMVGVNGNKYFVSSCDKGPDHCTHWVTRDTSHTKFYFQHLSSEQCDRFIALYNEKRLKFEGGFGFYVLPFFCKRVEVPNAGA